MLKTSSAPTQHLHQPLQYIMQAVEVLLIPPPIEAPSAQHIEEELLWQRYNGILSYIAYLKGNVQAGPPERAQNLEEHQTTLREGLNLMIASSAYASAAKDPEWDVEVSATTEKDQGKSRPKA